MSTLPQPNFDNELENVGQDDTYLDSHDLNFLETVLDRAFAELERSGPLDGQAEVVRRNLAMTIVRQRFKGERDPDQLMQAALASLKSL